MDPTQTPNNGGAPANNNDELKQMIEGLTSTVTEKLGEFDTRMSDLATENAELKKYLTTPPDNNNQPDPNNQPAGWVPKSWDDFPALVEQKTAEIVSKTLNDAAQKQNEMTEEQKRQQQAIDREIDNQLDKLTKEGVLPPVSNPRDPNDPGNVARKELLSLGVALETPNLEQVAHNVLVPQHNAGSRFDPNTGQWIKADPLLPGRFSPVGSSSSRTSSTPAGPDYKVIHQARSLDDLVAYADANGYGPAPAQQ